ncbi:MAG: hypothetical protein GY820_21525 [Gammaproteobacteria bacterium]|nr:hypothetical protein [Gammaproteobacteria bacterium]
MTTVKVTEHRSWMHGLATKAAKNVTAAKEKTRTLGLTLGLATRNPRMGKATLTTQKDGCKVLQQTKEE